MNHNAVDFTNIEEVIQKENILKQILSKPKLNREEITFLNHYLTQKEAILHQLPITPQSITLITYLNKNCDFSYKHLKIGIRQYQSIIAACETKTNDPERPIFTIIFHTNNYKKDIPRWNVVQTIFHETRHALQTAKPQLFSPSYQYRFLCENIIIEIDTKFYQQNYGAFLQEKDAEIFGIEQTINLFQKNNLLLSTEEQKNLNRSINDIQQRNDVQDQLLITQKLEQLIQEKPEILEENKELQIEFNPDGTRKNIKQLIRENNANTIDQNILDYLIYNAIYLDPDKERNLITLTAFEQSKVQAAIARYIQSLVATRSKQNNIIQEYGLPEKPYKSPSHR